MTDSTWLTPRIVVAWIEDDDPGAPVTDRAALQDAAAGYVEGIQPDLFVDGEDPEVDPPVYTPTPEIKLGAIMLAARYLARRGTTLGVAGFSEFGSSPILRYDPDIQRLLKIGVFAPFIFGAPTPVDEDVEA
jgi:hypothetical protein